MSDFSLKGHHAVVCGSTQGIGLEIARLFAEKEAVVTLMARDEAKLAEIVRSLDTASGQTHGYIVADFNDSEAVEAELEANADRLRGATILVNNSGGPPAGMAHEAKADEFRVAFERHLVASHLLVKALQPAMVQAEYGRIINIISTSVKSPIPGLGVSNTIRGAVASWAKTLAYELGPFGITVNNILPGATATSRLDSIIENKARRTRQSVSLIREEMIAEIPARRFASPRETAYAALFLASPQASYINGINLPVDGGRLGCL